MQAANMQTALYAALNVPGVRSLLAQGLAHPPIYADVPQDIDGQAEAAFPYVSFGPATITPWNVKDTLGENAVVQIDIWTRERQFTRNKAIADAVRAAIDRVPLAMPGWIDTQMQTTTFMRDPDGKTRRGLMLFRVLALP